ncbi:MAG: peptidoglycan-binding protein [Hyphomicrobiales bacterium]|jgi:chemotaxis protein MotB
MPRINRRANNNSANYWPGFVDAMATILLVIIFLLTVFILSQFFLSTEISSKDEALIDLQSQLQELSLLLSLEQNENQNLATKIELLESDLDELFSKNEQLSSSLAISNDEIVILQDEINNLNLDYQSQIIILQDNIDRQIALYDLERDQSAERNQQIIKLISENKQISSLLKMRELEINNKDLKIQNIEDNILNLSTLNKNLEETIGEKEQIIIDLRESLNKNNTLLTDYESSISSMNIASTDLESQINEKDQIIIDLRKKDNSNLNKINRLQSGLVSTGKKSKEASLEIELLNIQISELKKQISAIQALLDASEQKDIEQQARIADLGKRLNLALAQRVKELSEYRSEFFGKLREIIGTRDDIKIIGDRFVFQSEVLFGSGEATIGIDGQRQLAKLSVAIQDLIEEIPEEINWILRIDGHTDIIPIRNSKYQSNWDLSAARAISVVDFLMKTGIPPNRLAATGRGEYMPLDPNENEDAFRKNRRIEIKLTES